MMPGVRGFAEIQARTPPLPPGMHPQEVDAASRGVTDERIAGHMQRLAAPPPGFTPPPAWATAAGWAPPGLSPRNPPPEAPSPGSEPIARRAPEVNRQPFLSIPASSARMGAPPSAGMPPPTGPARAVPAPMPQRPPAPRAARASVDERLAFPPQAPSMGEALGELPGTLGSGAAYALAKTASDQIPLADMGLAISVSPEMAGAISLAMDQMKPEDQRVFIDAINAAGSGGRTVQRQQELHVDDQQAAMSGVGKNGEPVAQNGARNGRHGWNGFFGRGMSNPEDMRVAPTSGHLAGKGFDANGLPPAVKAALAALGIIEVGAGAPGGHAGHYEKRRLLDAGTMYGRAPVTEEIRGRVRP